MALLAIAQVALRELRIGELPGGADQKVVDAVRGGDRIERVTIEGDADGLLAAHADRVAEWNRTLDSAKA